MIFRTSNISRLLAGSRVLLDTCLLWQDKCERAERDFAIAKLSLRVLEDRCRRLERRIAELEREQAG